MKIIKQIITIIYTGVVRFILFIICLLFVIPFIIIACIPQKYRWRSNAVYSCMHFYYWLVVKGSLLPVYYRGLENIPTQPSVIIANHQSSLDIPLIGILTGGYPHIWLARSELMKTVVLRYVLPIFSVVVDVTSTRAAMLSLRQVLLLLQDNTRHLILFPEGSRFDDGTVHEFFNGFVAIAKKSLKPVIPVYITGVNKVYPRGSFFVMWHPVTVTVVQSFMYNADDDDTSFKERVYSWFVSQSQIK